MDDRPNSELPQLRAVAGLRTHRIPCAPGHDVVYGLARGRGGDVYLSASNEFFPGLCAVVFAYSPATGAFRPVIDVQAETGFVPETGRMPHSKVHLCLNAASDGRAFACTHFTAPGIGQTDFEPIAAYRGQFEGCSFLEYRPAEDRVVNHGRLLVGEGARISCFDDVHQQYYFLSYPRNHLYRYDCARRTLHDLGRMGQENSFGLEVDTEGNVFTSDDLGRIVVYSFARDRVEETDLFVPHAPGRRAGGNYIRRMATGPDGCFYGFGNKGARMFRLDPRRRTLDDLGVIHGREARDERGFACLPPAKAVTAGAGQSVLIAFGGDGIYRDGQPVPTLVRYDIASGRATELGRFIAPDDGVPAWIPQCAVTAPDLGAAFFGFQQTTGGLRLWEVPLNAAADTQDVANAEPYREHVAVIARQPFGASVEGANGLPFVKFGQVSMRELGWLGEDRVLPSGETAIAALGRVGDTLYGVTVGRRSHLFSFRPNQQNRFTENYEVHPWDLGVVEDAPTASAVLAHDAAGQHLLVATCSERGLAVHQFPIGEERRHYRGAYHSLPHWPPVAWSQSPLSLLFRAAGVEVRSVVFLEKPAVVVWTTGDGRVFSAAAESNAAPRELSCGFAATTLAALGDNRFAAFADDGSGRVFQLAADGLLRPLAVTPALRGRIVSVSASPNGEQLACGMQDGRVEVLSVVDGGAHLRSHLPRSWPVQALAWHPGGAIYGFYGESDGIGEAFAVDPAAGSVRELGILQVSSQPRYWMCHRCEAIAIGDRGEVHFGEHDRIAHLFTLLDTPAFPGSSLN